MTDEQLFAAFQAGDDTPLSRLDSRYRDPVVRYCALRIKTKPTRTIWFSKSLAAWSNSKTALNRAGC